MFEKHKQNNEMNLNLEIWENLRIEKYETSYELKAENQLLSDLWDRDVSKVVRDLVENETKVFFHHQFSLFFHADKLVSISFSWEVYYWTVWVWITKFFP